MRRTRKRKLIHDTCTICNKYPARACTACRLAAYCSLECQQTDWPLYKTVCNSFTSLPSGATALHRLGFLFLVTLRVSELIWIPCEEQIKDQFAKYEQPMASAFLDNDNSYVGSKVITKDQYLGFDHDHAVVIFYREAAGFDGSKSNNCIASTSRGLAATNWRGPIVIMNQLGTDPEQNFYQDVTAADLRVAFDFFVSYLNPPTTSFPPPQIPGNKVQGVKVNCQRDMDVDRVERFIPVSVPIDHPVFIHGEGPQIPKLLGLELFVRKYPTPQSRKAAQASSRNNFENPKISVPACRLSTCKLGVGAIRVGSPGWFCGYCESGQESHHAEAH